MEDTEPGLTDHITMTTLTTVRQTHPANRLPATLSELRNPKGPGRGPGERPAVGYRPRRVV